MASQKIAHIPRQEKYIWVKRKQGKGKKKRNSPPWESYCIHWWLRVNGCLTILSWL